MMLLNNLNMLAIENEEWLEEMRQHNVERRTLRDASNPFNLNENYFIELFRINKDMAQYVFNRISGQLNQSENPVAVPIVLKFFASLYFYATGSYQRTVGESFNLSMAQPTISRAVTEVSSVIQNELGQEWIRFPNTEEEMNRTKARFMEATGFPGVIGAIDCTHIAIVAPQEEEHNYVNRKGYHSMNVQLICDFDLNIHNVNARYPGATHDAFIWRQSAVYRLLQQVHLEGNQNTWLLGDSGYPLQPWLMTPIVNAQQDTPEARYTDAHIQARNCVARCIGVLKTRFRCLLRERVLRYSPEKVGMIVNVCCILHNICRRGNLEEVHIQEVAPNDGGQIEDEQRGLIVRENIVRRYFT